MKTILTLAFLFVASLVYAQSGADEKLVMETEKQRFDALVAKNYEVLDKLLADDLVYTHSTGVQDNKQSFLQSIRDGKLQYNSVTVQEQKVRIYGNTAIVNGIALVKAINNGAVNDIKLRYTDAYVKKGAQWQMVTWQSLRINNP